MSINNNNNNNEFDEIFNIVNKNAIKVEQEMERERHIRECVSMIDAAVTRSINDIDRKQEVRRNLQELQDDNIKRIKRAAGALALSAAIILGVVIPKVQKNWEEVQIVNATIEETKQELRDYGLAFLDYGKNEYELMREGPFTIRDNSVQDYTKLGIHTDDIDHIYSYMKVLDKEEEQDFIRSIQTDDGIPYENFDDYLERNGYNKSSFEKTAKEQIIANYNANNTNKGGHKI